ncbi:MAG TPA: GlsB/YeaQ/YmgE family stress response membrane protein [Acidimicrobiia bacterium]|nr:GlsB/YeaQ/YmgE family stress response membrane protein [Acidimicrobiia bacterium]
MDESLWTTIWQGLLAGVIIGPLARLVLPGKQNISMIMTIILGAVGAVGGGLIYTELLDMGATSGIDWTLHIIQVAVGAIAVLLFGMLMKGRSEAAPPSAAPPPTAPPPSAPPPTP